MWKWRVEQKRAFQHSKQLLVLAEVLVHYDSKKLLMLSVDASPYGMGAVLSHVMDDGTQRSIAFALRTLN